MKEGLPKISIVLPTYNGSRYIRQSIESCLNQTYNNIELIIVDDCSSDNTPDIIRAYTDERIKYIKHKTNMGLPGALNTGFTNSSGEYLTWTSDDNFYTNDAIKKMSTYLKNKNCDFVYCNYYALQNDDMANAKLMELPEQKVLTEGNCLGACFLYTRKVWETVGEFDPKMIFAEDYDYWVRVSKKFTIRHCNEPLYFYRFHKKSLTYSKVKEVKVMTLLIRFKYDVIDILDTRRLIEVLMLSRSDKFYKLNQLIIKLVLAGKIHTLLQKFKNGAIDFPETKEKLLNLIESNLLIIFKNNLHSTNSGLPVIK